MLNQDAFAGLAFLWREQAAGFSHPHAGPASRYRCRACPGLACSFFSSCGPDLFRTGTGISIYRLPYFLVRQVFIHRRIKVFNKLVNHVYLKAVYLAHQLHAGSSLRNQTGTAGLLGVAVNHLTLAQRNNMHL
jgi:hypothetical protein